MCVAFPENFPAWIGNVHPWTWEIVTVFYEQIGTRAYSSTTGQKALLLSRHKQWLSSIVPPGVFVVSRSTHLRVQQRNASLLQWKLRPWQATVALRMEVVFMTQPAIELKQATKRFLTPVGKVYTAARDINMAVALGEFVAVVGPTGCGKSTTLGLISGLEPPSTGEVLVLRK